ncbi:MAG: M1 family metallopeptidase [Leptospirales bacterium]
MPFPDLSLYQLPRDIRPIHYDLLLVPDLERFTFDGEVSIQVEIYRNTLEFVLNASDLKIHKAHATVDGFDFPLWPEMDPEFERVIFRGTRLFEAETKAVLRIRFSGVLNDLLAGFYRSSYRSPDGQERFLATTQFEATDARKAFPCWDEPSIKATFRVTARVPESFVALSNMPVEREEIRTDGRKDVVFRTTPKMSTYLLHLTCGLFERVSGKTGTGVEISVWTTPGRQEEGVFARDVALKLLPWFDEYFGIPYPLPKMDLVAIPDFAAGAMENWGILTYRETALLLPAGESSARTTQRVAIVVAHEMAHQWFGDLVTMSWWDDLWLNEGFASWMEVKAVDFLFPEWKVWDLFLAEDMTEALELDGLEHSHPIEIAVRNPHEINEIFDAISYVKGGSLIRMLERFLGEGAFREGLSRYLSQFAYGNACTADLWNALSRVSGKDVRGIMESWTRQMGYPVLMVEEESPFRVTQRPFRNHPRLMDGMKGKTDGVSWKVMMGLSGSSGEPVTPHLLEARTGTLPSPSSGGVWNSLNAGHVGFYRVLYSGKMRKELLEEIRAGRMPVSDRLGFGNDLFALGRAGMVPLGEYLASLEAFRQEDQYIVWTDIASNIGWLDGLLAFGDSWKSLSRFVIDLMRPAFERAGWSLEEGESHQERLLRSLLLSCLGISGDPGIVAGCRERFERFLQDRSSLPPDLRLAVFRTVSRHGDESEHKLFAELAGKAESQEEKNRYLAAMAASGKEALLEKTLELSLSGLVRIQDTVSVVSQVGSNPYGERLAWSFFRDRFDLFRKRYESGGFALQRLVKGVSEGFRSREDQIQVETFFRDHPLEGARRTIEQVLETIDLRTQILEREEKSVSDVLGRW